MADNIFRLDGDRLRLSVNRQGRQALLCEVTDAERAFLLARAGDAEVFGQRARRVAHSGGEIAEALLAVPAEDAAADGEWTLQEAVDRTFQLVWNGTPSERTNTFNTRSALRFFGTTFPVVKITPERIAEYRAHCHGIGNAHSTVNKKLLCLSRVLRTAFERGKLATMPLIRLGKNAHSTQRDSSVARGCCDASPLEPKD